MATSFFNGFIQRRTTRKITAVSNNNDEDNTDVFLTEEYPTDEEREGAFEEQVLVTADYSDQQRGGIVAMWSLPQDMVVKGKPDQPADIALEIGHDSLLCRFKAHMDVGYPGNEFRVPMSLSDYKRMALICRLKGASGVFSELLRFGAVEDLEFGLDDMGMGFSFPIEEQTGFRKAILQVLNFHITTLTITESLLNGEFLGQIEGLERVEGLGALAEAVGEAQQKKRVLS